MASCGPWCCQLACVAPSTAIFEEMRLAQSPGKAQEVLVRKAQEMKGPRCCALQPPSPMPSGPPVQPSRSDSSLADGLARVNTGNSREKALRTSLANELRRGVRLETALSGFGRHWSGKITGGQEVEQDGEHLFRLSEHCDGIHDFLSHDWATPRYLKFISLCLVYNCRAAIVVSFLTSLTLGFLQSDLINALPRPFPFVKSVAECPAVETKVGCLGAFLGPVTFICALLTWQRLRRVCRWTPHFVFLDKLCIHQTDLDMKRAGILALAGFLDLSGRLVVLWSPRYLRRLWCVYELATWVHLRKGSKAVFFMPVALGFIVVALFGGVWLYYLALTLASMGAFTSGPLSFSAVGVLLVACPLVCFLARNLSEHLHEMSSQIAGFSARSAECFCCSTSHRHPVTGEDIPCDRELVFGALQDWFRGANLPEEEDGDYLTIFDREVRERLGPEVLTHTGGARLPYKFSLVVSVPAFGYLCDRITAILVMEWRCAARVLLEYAITVFCVVPLVAKLLLLLAFLQREFFSRVATGKPVSLRSSKGLGLRGAAGRCILLVALTVMWTPAIALTVFIQLYLVQKHSLSAQVAYTAVLTSLTIAGFRGFPSWPCPRNANPNQQETPNKQLPPLHSEHCC